MWSGNGDATVASPFFGQHRVLEGRFRKGLRRPAVVSVRKEKRIRRDGYFISNLPLLRFISILVVVDGGMGGDLLY